MTSTTQIKTHDFSTAVTNPIKVNSGTNATGGEKKKRKKKKQQQLLFTWESIPLGPLAK